MSGRRAGFPGRSTSSSSAWSGMATQAFRAAGWDAYNLQGGIAEWHRRGLPLEPDGGAVADH